MANRRRERNIEECDWHLSQSTIFQCEMFAIKKAAEWVIENHNKPYINKFNSVAIYSDSLSSLQALLNYETKSQLIKDTFDTLNTAANLVPITLRWVKAHANHPGNDRADDLANIGAFATDRDPVPDLPKMPFSQMKSSLHRKALEIWNDEWVNNKYTKHRHRQSKNWWPGPDGSKAKKLVQSSSRIAFSRKISIYTGFGPFNYHEHVITQGEVSKYCTSCKIENKVEDAEHILIECEKFGPTRQAIFGDPPPAMNLLTDKQLSDFINETYNQGFPWFPPNDGEPVEEGDNISIMSEAVSNNYSDSSVTDSETPEEPSSGSVHSDTEDRINPNIDQYLDDLEVSSVHSNQPGFALYNPDSESENEARF